MGLSIIGAGFGRTGTDSLRNALEILGFGPCYHMFEVLPHQDRIDTWRGVAAGNVPDWDHIFADYSSTVDWPAAFYWQSLSQHFPKAKIILSVRDSDAWFESMDVTILKSLREITDAASIGQKLIVDQVFEGNIDDREHVIAAYEKNNRDVQAAFSPDRLLTYEVGTGWEPLCQFLNVPIPSEPYPHGNKSKDFSKNLAAKQIKSTE